MASCYCMEYWLGDSEDEESVIMKSKEMNKNTRGSKIQSSGDSSTWCSDEFWGEHVDETWMDISLQDNKPHGSNASSLIPIQFINISTTVDDTWKIDDAARAEYSPQGLPRVFKHSMIVPNEDPKQIQLEQMEFQASTGTDELPIVTTKTMEKQKSSSLSTLTLFSFDQPSSSKTNSMIEIYRDPLTGRKKTKVHELGTEATSKKGIRLWPRRVKLGKLWKK